MRLIARRHQYYGNGEPFDSTAIARREVRRRVQHVLDGSEEVSRHELRLGVVALHQTLDHGYAVEITGAHNDTEEIWLSSDLQAAIGVYQTWVRALS